MQSTEIFTINFTAAEIRAIRHWACQHIDIASGAPNHPIVGSIIHRIDSIVDNPMQTFEDET